jgi:hypothetical protein
MRTIAGQKIEESFSAGISMLKGCIRRKDLWDKEVNFITLDQGLLDCLAHHELTADVAGLGFCIATLVDVQKPRPNYTSPLHWSKRRPRDDQNGSSAEPVPFVQRSHSN